MKVTEGAENKRWRPDTGRGAASPRSQGSGDTGVQPCPSAYEGTLLSPSR